MRAGTQGRSESSHDQGSVLLLSATMTEGTLYPYTNIMRLILTCSEPKLIHVGGKHAYGDYIRT